MEALKYNIRVLTYHGLYDDKKKEYPSLKTLIFSAVLILIVTFEAGSFSDLFITTENLQDFTNALLMFLAGSSSMMKMLNFYHQKHLLRAIIQDLNKHICHPRSLEEKKICRRSIIIVQGLFIVIFTFGYITVATALIAPFVSSEEDIKLPYPMFSFMNLANKKIFASLYVIELLVCVTIIPILTTADTLVYGMFILISEQYELLAYRLNHVAMSENCGEAIDRCIEHHSLILEIVSKVKKLLMGIISYFFGTCVVNLCFTILQMSMVSLCYLKRKVTRIQSKTFTAGKSRQRGIFFKYECHDFHPEPTVFSLLVRK